MTDLDISNRKSHFSLQTAVKLKNGDSILRPSQKVTVFLLIRTFLQQILYWRRTVYLQPNTRSFPIRLELASDVIHAFEVRLEKALATKYTARFSFYMEYTIVCILILHT
ncbi:hypothetical protein KFK09_000724 [Dendrobium nobile]|uniref:Uncharacterized protein n=1 Tax=Dendrobium nobile TaxID=94219 RepID=A0A8T3C9Q8_DENNO|nr:hypothetical protein KFK09_000724 [Dendrobium nobile]